MKLLLCLWSVSKLPFQGVLLYGPPGCGKTLIAKATAREAKFRFINLQPSTLTDKWYGESQKLAAAVFSLAIKLQPSIIFIDEIGEPRSAAALGVCHRRSSDVPVSSRMSQTPSWGAVPARIMRLRLWWRPSSWACGMAWTQTSTARWFSHLVTRATLKWWRLGLGDLKCDRSSQYYQEYPDSNKDLLIATFEIP